MSSPTYPVIVVSGPTAVGKTKTAIAIAKALNGEIISADSRQFYREISIGTAKPDTSELAAVPHHFIDILSICETYTAGQFERDALAKIEALHHQNKTAIIAGGSGLYIKALLNGFDDLPSDAAVRSEVIEFYQRVGLDGLQREVQKLDPSHFLEMDNQNPMRLMRALEMMRISGQQVSALKTGKITSRPFHTIKIGLDMERKELYRRIDARVDEMINLGLEKEARLVYAYKDTQALQTVGYKELFAHFENQISLDEAIELIKRNSRRYAKRQLTWLRRETDINWFTPEKQDDILHFITENYPATI